MDRCVTLPDGTAVPAIGQGTWFLGEQKTQFEQEKEALTAGVEAGIPLGETVECMEQLKKEGKIRRWGVSNFDTDDMEELWEVPGGRNCAANQVLYHVASRGIEYDLLPWMREHHVPLMAYCPLAQGGDLCRGLYENPVLKKLAAAHNAAVSQVLLAFVVRDGSTVAIPRSSRKAHTLDNAGADKLVLTEAELAAIDREFPAPVRKVYLDIV